MTQKEIIGVDFDRVLFDTDRFNEAMKEATGLHHVDADVYDGDGNYSPEKHAEAAGVDIDEIYRFIRENVQKFLYPDVKALEELDQEVWIVTRGEEKFQRAKVENSGIEKLVDNLEIVEEGGKDVGIDYLIDDRRKELELADLPGYVLDRSQENLGDAVEEVKKREA